MKLSYRYLILATFLTLFLGVVGCRREKKTFTSGKPEWAVPSDNLISAMLKERMLYNGIGMVVGVIDGERQNVVTNGLSGAENGRALDGETVFQLGSLTKVITNLLLAEMVTSGEVGLDDLVSDFLPPEIKLVEVGRPITLRDLATHTSGLPSMPTNFDIHGEPDPYAAYSVDQLWSFLSSYTPEGAPGIKYAYSNLGVSLLGWVLALRMNTTYEDLVKDRVLGPLEMNSTSITLSSEQLARLAPGHSPYLQPIRTWEMATLQASGSLRSTANDMLRLLELYLGKSNNSHMVEAAKFQMREGVELDGTFLPLGLGLRSDGIYRHAGGKQGYRSGLAFNARTGVAAVVLSNARTYESEPMLIAMHLVAGEILPPAARAPEDKPRVNIPTNELEKFAGGYHNKAGEIWEVVVSRKFLRIRYPNNSIFEFVPSGSHDFYYNAGNDDIIFDLDDNGKVVGMRIYGDGKSEGDNQFVERVNKQ
ncbi:serine hydrolase [Ekhidna sp.]|uniref:serine hydrolase n=1 Tax=Ekhidna sp. TaxID=2608089 RepID=UPI003298049B